jgi:integrase
LTKREAEAFDVSERANQIKGAWVDPRLTRTPLASVAEDWLRSDARKRARSIERDRGILTKHILPTLGSKPVGSITRADVQRLVKSWTGRYPASTLGRQYSTLRAVLSYAESSELIVRSPCRHIPVPQATPREAQILDGDDLERLAGAVGNNGPMVYLAALGLRWGEIAGLRVGRLDFLCQTLTVAIEQTQGEGGRMVVQDPRQRRDDAPSPFPIG